MSRERLDAALALLDPTPAEFFPGRGDERDPRLGERVRPLTRDTLDADVVILGCPDEAGLLLNHGRPGASQGPAAIRRELYRHTVGCTPRVDGLKLVDAGDVRVAHSQDRTHERVARVVSTLAASSGAVVLLGGSHDLSCPGVAGLAQAVGEPVGVLLLDAHLDIRDLRFGLTNGSPFFALMEGGFLRGEDFVVLGAQPWANSPDYLAELERRGGTVRWLDEMEGQVRRVGEASLGALGQRRRHLAVSVDIDVAPQAAAPGTGAPGALGLPPGDLAALAWRAGAASQVRYLDLMEVSPPHDQDGRTALLAATIIHSFLAGRASIAPGSGARTEGQDG